MIARLRCATQGYGNVQVGEIPPGSTLQLDIELLRWVDARLRCWRKAYCSQCVLLVRVRCKFGRAVHARVPCAQLTPVALCVCVW